MDYTHKQVRKLTDNQKVEIVLQKELRPTPTSTNKNIAEEFGVHPSLIAHTSYNSLTPDQKALYEKKRQELAIHAFDLTFDSVVKAKSLVQLATGVKDLPAVMGAAKIGNDIYRLETNQPTTITQQNIEPTAQALLNAINQYRDFCQQNNLAFPTNEQLIERINQVASERNIDAKLLQERVLGSDKC